MSHKTPFAELLPLARERCGMSQSDLARKIGKVPQAISSWERGKTQPSLEDLSLVSTALYTSPNWLLGFYNNAHIKCLSLHHFVASLRYSWRRKMGFEIFSKKSRSTETGLEVTIGSHKNIVLGRIIVENYLNGCNYAHLLWDADTKRLGIRPLSGKDDNAYGVHYTNDEKTVAQLSAAALLSSILYKPKEVTPFRAKWNAKEKQLEIQLTGEVLGKRRRRKRRRKSQ
jgi:transcriptional regulator with XRE-family HTH domain